MSFLTEDEATVFNCSNCGKLINTHIEKCRYCGTTIDKEESQKLADQLQTVNYAESDAGTLKILSYGFFAIAVPWKHFKGEDLIENLPFGKLPLKSVGAMFLFIPFLWMWFRWQRKYGKLGFSESEFADAKKTKNQSLWIAIAGIVLVIIIDVIITLIILRMENGNS